jgi:hypothetical protein
MCLRSVSVTNFKRLAVMAVLCVCVWLESNTVSLCQVTSLTISSSVIGLLPLASGQADTSGSNMYLDWKTTDSQNSF